MYSGCFIILTQNEFIFFFRIFCIVIAFCTFRYNILHLYDHHLDVLMYHLHFLLENETTVYHSVENTHVTVIQLFRMLIFLIFVLQLREMR